MRPRARVALIVATGLLAVPALAACSSDDSTKPAAAATPTRALGPAPAAVPNPPADDSVDAGFARDMRTHHAQAVQMAMMVRDLTQDDATRKLAYDIALTQQEQIGRMASWLQLWGLTLGSTRPVMQWMTPGSMPGHSGHGTPAAGADTQLMPGMATQAQLDKLATLHGKDAEVMFLQLMITHHEAGVAMAREGVARAQVQQVRDLANTMVVGQSSEIDLMRSMLTERGAA
ncbi:DUF305 domain-containing protein [Embleya scabrispora]|uniref:DUF305 domain-containing protein n=1 Tax=Embleya scabrispora TaxID=159449 RepID=UPI00035FEB19|nr:DUF305 domain-containing protein [Embleya scabrispora]MYS78975.1 DUF305 domain-containing protein [Streptomyces sp. SID5474]